ncbi:MAG: ABC transporter ATP-binding protein [Coriobacteriales bacterium]|jgi:iron complex transport system ATP-binding protein|nr:ABC transporter ATP-binding protein [Coriobacteriales bacterium]
MIELRDATFTYNHKPFIDGLSLKLETGQISTIIGPNGCGKSTLVKLISRQLHPQHGSVLLDGHDIRHLKTRDFARQVALLAQSSFVPNMEVEQLVLCGRYPHQSFVSAASPDDRRLVEDALSLTGAIAFREKNIRNLSGGERQKVFLAMALAQDTRVIVLDEPTSYLDIHACQDVMQLVQRLNTELGKTIIMVLHDLQNALHYSHNILVMQKGAIIQSGSAEKIVASNAIEEAFQINLKCFWENGNPYYAFTAR